VEEPKKKKDKKEKKEKKEVRAPPPLPHPPPPPPLTCALGGARARSLPLRARDSAPYSFGCEKI